MGPSFCSRCGAAIPAGATFCPSCGWAVSGASATAAPPPPPGYGLTSPALRGYSPVGHVGVPGISPDAARSVDRFSLGRVTLAAAIALAGAIAYVAELLAGNIGSLVQASSTSSGGVVLSLPPIWTWVALLGASGALSLIELLLFRSAFHRLAGLDRRFATPSTLALIAFIGFLLLFFGLILLIGSLYQGVQCAGSGNPVTSACLLTGAFWGGIALAGIGGIIAIVGYIGTLVGIWRLGSRYGDGLFKAGAVLLIFPVLNLVAAILVLVAARNAARKVEAAGSPATPSW